MQENAIVIDWTAISAVVTAMSTVVIAILTWMLWFIQKKQHKHDAVVADANFRLSLHEKRLELIHGIEEFIADFYQTGEPDMYKASHMMFRLRDADLIFPKEVLEGFKEFRDKAGKYYVLKSRTEALKTDAGGGISWSGNSRPPDEEIDKHKKKRLRRSAKTKMKCIGFQVGF